MFQPCGVDYELKTYVAENPDEKPHKRCRFFINLTRCAKRNKFARKTQNWFLSRTRVQHLEIGQVVAGLHLSDRQLFVQFRPFGDARVASLGLYLPSSVCPCPFSRLTPPSITPTFPHHLSPQGPDRPAPHFTSPSPLITLTPPHPSSLSPHPTPPHPCPSFITTTPHHLLPHGPRPHFSSPPRRSGPTLCFRLLSSSLIGYSAGTRCASPSGS